MKTKLIYFHPLIYKKNHSLGKISVKTSGVVTNQNEGTSWTTNIAKKKSPATCTEDLAPNLP